MEKLALFYDDLRVLGEIDKSRQVTEIKEKNQVFEKDGELKARQRDGRRKEVKKTNSSPKSDIV